MTFILALFVYFGYLVKNQCFLYVMSELSVDYIYKFIYFAMICNKYKILIELHFELMRSIVVYLLFVCWLAERWLNYAPFTITFMAFTHSSEKYLHNIRVLQVGRTRVGSRDRGVNGLGCLLRAICWIWIWRLQFYLFQCRTELNMFQLIFN